VDIELQAELLELLVELQQWAQAQVLFRSTSRYARGGTDRMSARGFGNQIGGGIARRAIRDIQGATMRANRGYTSIQSTLKSWGV
jgi:hypothetical protein